MLSVLDMFRVGVGPSSSHTVGPMRIALRYGQRLARRRWPEGARVVVTLQGSLAFTGHGHGTLRAVALGLLGQAPETFDAAQAERDLAALERTRQLSGLAFDPATDIRLDYDTRDLLHPNAMRLAVLAGDAVLAEEEWFSTGGGFIASRRQLEQAAPADRVATALLGSSVAVDGVVGILLAFRKSRMERSQAWVRIPSIGPLMSTTSQPDFACVARRRFG